MKCPSRRNSFPNDTLSWTSTSWYGDRNASRVAADRTKKPQSSVICSVRIARARSSGGDSSCVIVDHLFAAAVNRLESLLPRLQRSLERLEHALGLERVVRRVVAHVDVDRHEPRFGPRMDREMRFGEQHRSGDALGFELEEAIADDRESGILDRTAAQIAQRVRLRQQGL